MVPYRPTKEDELLMQPYRTYGGQMMDIRWSGGWLTPEGVYHPVDYASGITHATIAEEHGSNMSGSGSIITSPPMMRLFNKAMWIRITYFEGSSFCIELRGDLGGSGARYSQEEGELVGYYDYRRKNELLKFVSDYKKGFETYFINEVEYNKYHEFVMAIKDDNVAHKVYLGSDPERLEIETRYFASKDGIVHKPRGRMTYDDLPDDDIYDTPTFMKGKV